MSPSLRALLEGVVDYAGMFPPAALATGPAIHTFADARGGGDRWMLGRFVCPASRLGELDTPGSGLFLADPPFHFAAIGRGGATPGDFLEGLAADLGAIEEFEARHADAVRVDVLEVKLPPPVLMDSRPAHALLEDAGEAICRHAARPMQIFYEAPPADHLRALLAVIAEWNRGVGDAPAAYPAGYKLRTGGTEAAAIPGPRQVAHALRKTFDAGVPMKCTAGLHHPLRHYDDSVQAKMHGFVNVLVAGVLAHARGAGNEQLAEVLAEEEPGAFTFAPDGLRWQEHGASISEIQAARRWLVSFGCCSFDEPRTDLRAMGWW